MDSKITNYQIKTDPSFILAVDEKVVFYPKKEKESEFKKEIVKDVNIVELSYLPVDEYDKLGVNYDLKKSIGGWNAILGVNVSESVNLDSYPIVAEFARTGIYASTLAGAGGEATLLILPPYQANHWNDYFNGSFLSEQVISKVAIIPAIYPLPQFLKKAEKDLMKMEYYKDAKEEIEKILAHVSELAKAEGLDLKPYVPTIVYNITPLLNQDALIGINAAFEISKTIIEAYRSGREVQILKVNTKRDINKIFRDNTEKLKGTENTFDHHILALYVQPVPVPVGGFRFTDNYKKIGVVNTVEEVPDNIIKSRKCVETECDLPEEGVAVGYIIHRLPGEEPKENESIINFDIDCNTMDPSKLQSQANEMEIEIPRLTGEKYYDYCQRVNTAIKKKLKESKQS
jgi:hypothetical protein